MSMSLCFYFQVHQPFRLRKDYDFFRIGSDHCYEDHESNRKIMQRVARKCYLPTNRLMLKLIKKHQGRFRISYSISGTALEQFEMYAPEVISSFQELVDTGHVEMINETYYHSLASIRSIAEFREQVNLHKFKIKNIFDVTPTTFRNTELIYNNELAVEVEKMGFKTILAEGDDKTLGWRSPNFVYAPYPCLKLKLLLKNYKLSDDIAFRFSNESWSEHPLTVNKFVNWIKKISAHDDIINLFMDYETFGEHQWEHTGIFQFLEKFPEVYLKNKGYEFLTPAQISARLEPVERISVYEYTSWADEERDLSAWMGNSMQNSVLDFAYSLEKAIKKSKDSGLIHTWRKLLTSDHFYYASTKRHNDGCVHNYFSPYDTPHDAYIVHSNILNDLKLTLKRHGHEC